jgi:hypothetical protein
MDVRKPSEYIALQLEQLAEICRQGHASELMVRTLEKLFGYERENSRSQLKELQRNLLAFEREHGMSSKDFFQRYQEGKTDDRMDFVEWASLVQMKNRLEKRLSILEPVQSHEPG